MIYLITNRALVKSDEEYFAKIKSAIDGGLDRIILREKQLGYDELLKYGKKIMELTKGTSCKVIVNSSLEVYKEINAYGLHLPYNKFLSMKDRIDNVGVSVHTLEEAIEVDRIGADYVLASNVYETKCKLGLEGKGVKFINNINKNISTKVIALGGINVDNYKEVYKAGADGVAIMSGIMCSKNPEKYILQLKNY
ncbi:Thiamine-phosphate pyrophosphorylase, putative [Clostridium bornimense]|uniref:Thiamine-phosphate pyrophosphorylase, putative n=1 Tax=Clostridium bornimense TaxID=1216932 RepID=W6RXY6_9CLOT|nr:thiamine phosphate synthase [Clostridium bornimense]CDM69516.1 Thiamine-phosphate pyrophosphorylase, putative [Clostridium bornimense]